VRAYGRNVDPTGGSGEFEVCTTVSTCQAGSISGNAGAMSFPSDVVIDGGDNAYVADAGNDRVDVFSATPSFLRAMGGDVDTGGAINGFETCTASCQAGDSNGSAGSLRDAIGVELDGGDLYVAEYQNDRVSVLDPAGAFQGAFGKDVVPGGAAGFEVCTASCQEGDLSGAAGALNQPVGIAFDGDNAYVTEDSPGNRVTTLASGPAFVDAFGADVIPGDGTAFEVCTTSCKTGLGGTGPGTIDGPQGIAIDGGGRLYVAETDINRVEVFEESNEFEFGKVKRNKRKGTAKLPVEVPGPGDVALAKTAKVKGDSEEVVGTAGTATLNVKARGKAKKKLTEKGKAKVRAVVTFTPLGGDPGTEAQKIKLKKKLAE
jgi:hypothetical protein